MNRRSLLLFLSGLFTLELCVGQATVTAVRNSASFTDHISPGSYVTIEGTGFSSSIVYANEVPFPYTLGGVSIWMGQIQCPVYSLTPTLINFIMPYSAPTGPATLTVIVNQQIIGPLNINVDLVAPGVFQSGANHAIVQNFPSYSTNSSASPAPTGSTIIVYMTGIGPVTNTPPPGTVTPANPPYSTATSPAVATIGGASAGVQFVGLSGGLVSVAVALLTVPNNLASGDYPLVITIGGIESTSAMVSVNGTGSALPTVFGFLGSATIPPFLPPYPLQGGYSGNVSIAIMGNYAYVCDANQISIMDISNPASPKFQSSFGSLDLAGEGYFCSIQQGDLVAMTTGDVRVYDLTNPLSPQRITLQSGFQTGNMLFSGNTLFVSTNNIATDQNLQIVSQGGEFYAYDFTSLQRPRFLSQLQPNPNQAGSNDQLRYGTAVFGQTAVIMGTSSSFNGDGQALFTTVDVSNPSVMAALGQTTLPNSNTAISVAANGNLALIGGNSKWYVDPLAVDTSTLGAVVVFGGNLTLHTVDFTAPRNPTILASVVTSIQTTGGYTIESLGNNFFYIKVGPPLTNLEGPQTIVVVDARDPKNPVVWPQLTVQGIQGMSYSNGKLYIDTMNAFDIFSVTIPQ